MAEALVVVDFQNDFTPGGALAVPEGDAIAPRVLELIGSGRFDLVVATRDWHGPDHLSFAENGGPWPPHCVQGTPGAELHDSVPRDRVEAVVDKGQAPDDPGYDAFEGTNLATLLRERAVDAITIVGLATDYCVKNTALGGLREGFDVVVDRKGVRGIDVEPGDVEQAIADVTAAGGRVT
jgi:nicotinamidase/pyrazinamidase